MVSTELAHVFTNLILPAIISPITFKIIWFYVPFLNVGRKMVTRVVHKEYTNFGKYKPENRWHKQTFKPIMDLEEAFWILNLK